jgi:hypothetical protein
MVLLRSSPAPSPSTHKAGDGRKLVIDHWGAGHMANRPPGARGAATEARRHTRRDEPIRPNAEEGVPTAEHESTTPKRVDGLSGGSVEPLDQSITKANCPQESSDVIPVPSAFYAQSARPANGPFLSPEGRDQPKGSRIRERFARPKSLHWLLAKSLTSR